MTAGPPLTPSPAGAQAGQSRPTARRPGTFETADAAAQLGEEATASDLVGR
jgi:hypothetical protein